MALGSLNSSLKKTREGVFSRITRLVTGKKIIDEDLLNELEEILISGDVGVNTSLFILDHIRNRVRKHRYETTEELNQLIKDEISGLLPTLVDEQFAQKPYVVLVVGVNGTGKTTSIAKMAHYFKEKNKDVLLAAADTFRAAAIDQLCIWGERIGCEVIKHQSNADPAAVVYDAVSASIARNSDMLIIDTAGRLHTKTHLMAELEKIKKVITRQIPEGPHEVVLALDAGNGQNAINQAKEFIKSAGVNSIFLTKLDGTAKGGVVLSINRELGIPVKYIGTGEKKEDFAIFNPAEFVKGLFDEV